MLSDATVLRWALIATVVSLVVSVLLITLVLAWLPADYFSRDQRPRRPAHALAGHLWPLLIVLKNVLGAGFIVLGVILLVLPGQGLLTILIGLVMTDFPGKYRLERWLVSRPGLHELLNRFRARVSKPPFDPPA